MAALQLTMCAATGLVLMNAHSSLSRAMALCWLPNTLACYMGISAGTAKLMGMANDNHLYVWGLLGKLLSLSLEFCPLFLLLACARVRSRSLQPHCLSRPSLHDQAFLKLTLEVRQAPLSCSRLSAPIDLYLPRAWCV